MAGTVPQPATNLADDGLIKRTPLSELSEDCLSTATAAQDKAQALRWGTVLYNQLERPFCQQPLRASWLAD